MQMVGWLRRYWRHSVGLLLLGAVLYILIVPNFCGRPVTITRQMRPGEQWRYTLVQTFQLKDQSAQLELQITDTVKTVQPYGSAIVERTIAGDPEAIQALREHMRLFGELPERMRLRFTPEGEEIPMGNTAVLLTSVPYAYPHRAVRVGEQWEKLHTLGSMKTRYRCRFTGWERVEGAPCYKIVARAEPLPDSLPQIQGEVTVYLDTRRKWTRAIHGKLIMAAGSFQAHTTLELKGHPAEEGKTQ